VSLRTVRGAAALAGLVPVRVALALGASFGLHWGALHALGDGPERQAPRASTTPVVMVAAVGAQPAPPPAADPLRSADAAAAAPVGIAAGSIARAPDPATHAVSQPSAVRREPDRGAAGTRSTLPDVRVEASRREPVAGAQPEPVYLEAWEVDHPPEFLVAPDGLDALPALAGGAVELRVAVRVDATGRRGALEVDAGEVPPEAARRLARGVEAAFEDVAFMPARRDGRPVPAVIRWSVALDPRAPIALGFRLQN
jgi:hypothetical protein